MDIWSWIGLVISSRAVGAWSWVVFKVWTPGRQARGGGDGLFLCSIFPIHIEEGQGIRSDVAKNLLWRIKDVHSIFIWTLSSLVNGMIFKGCRDFALRRRYQRKATEASQALWLEQWRRAWIWLRLLHLDYAILPKRVSCYNDLFQLIVMHFSLLISFA